MFHLADESPDLSPEQLAIEHRRLLVSRHYLHGRSSRWIGKKLEISHSTVLRDLHAIAAEWSCEAVANIDALRGKQVARLEELIRTYWKAWERSIGEHTVTRSEVSTGGENGGTKDVTTTEKLAGDPRYLAGFERCLEQIAKLQGLNAAVKVDATHRGVLALERDLMEGV